MNLSCALLGHHWDVSDDSAADGDISVHALTTTPGDHVCRRCGRHRGAADASHPA